MHTSLLILAAAAVPVIVRKSPCIESLEANTSLQCQTGTNLPLGSVCDPTIPDACANGVACYALQFGLEPRCGMIVIPAGGQSRSTTSPSALASSTTAAMSTEASSTTEATSTVSSSATAATSTAPSSTELGLPLGAASSPNTVTTITTTVTTSFCTKFNISTTTTAIAANTPTYPLVSGNSSVATHPSQPSSTSPIMASHGTKLNRSLVGLFGVAILFALAL
jgi:hypothetical protein